VTFTVQRLGDSARAALLTHFLALPAEDQRLRFGASLSPLSIAAYVEGIDFDSSALFAVHDDRLQLVGVAHVAFGDDRAELGLSVLPAYRGHGLGGAMFERAVAHARNRLVTRIFMHCLVENVAIMRLAQKFDMDIVLDSGDADAHLALPPPSVASVTAEFVTNRVAQYDHALKLHAAAVGRINALLLPRDPHQASGSPSSL
jgi:GNAT superfamily N-acetyltransferase